MPGIVEVGKIMELKQTYIPSRLSPIGVGRESLYASIIRIR